MEEKHHVLPACTELAHPVDQLSQHYAVASCYWTLRELHLLIVLGTRRELLHLLSLAEFKSRHVLVPPNLCSCSCGHVQSCEE